MKKDIFKTIIILFTLAILFGSITSSAYAGTFSDNFDDGNADGWWLGFSHHTPWVNGNWRVEDGKLVQDQAGDEFIALIDNLNLSAQTIETQLHTLGPSGYGGVTIWYKDNFHYTVVGMYPAAGLIYVTERTGDGWEYIHSTNYATPSVLTCAILCNLKVIADDVTGKLDIYLNDVYDLTYTVLTTYRTGQSGLLSGNAGGYFDNFSITSPLVVDPLIDKAQCKNDGWKKFNNHVFKNQGECVSYLQSNERAGKRK